MKKTVLFFLITIQIFIPPAYLYTAATYQHQHLSAWTDACCKTMLEFNHQDPQRRYQTCLQYEDLRQAIVSYIDLFKRNGFLDPNQWQGVYQNPPEELINLENEWRPDKSGTPNTYGLHGKPLYPFVQKKIIPLNSTIVFIGDLHGSIHSLLRNLWRLVVLGHLDNNFTIKTDNFYIIFTGDLVDRGSYGCEVIYTILRLMIANPKHIILTRGNHEDFHLIEAQSKKFHEISLQTEFDKKFPGHSITPLLKFFEYLPFALFLGVGNNQNAQFVQCCHGGIETGFDPKPLIGSSKKFEKISDTINHSEELLAVGEKDKYDNYAGFNWSDFTNDKNYTTLKLNSEGSHGHPDGLGYVASVKVTREHLANNQLKAFFRGHQDKSFGFKMLFKEDIDTSNLVDSGIKTQGQYKHGPYDWKQVIPDNTFSKTLLPDKIPHGFLTKDHAPIFTLTSASEGQAVPYDCFILVTTSQEYDNWLIRPCEVPLNQSRHGKYCMIRLSSNALNILQVDWGTDPDQAGVNALLIQKAEPHNPLQKQLIVLKKKLAKLSKKLHLLKEALTKLKVNLQ